jgi:hypothetical protein
VRLFASAPFAINFVASSVLSALTAVISDAGLGLQPERGKRERTRAKRNSGLHFIAAGCPFDMSADPAVFQSLTDRQRYENSLEILPT